MFGSWTDLIHANKHRKHDQQHDGVSRTQSVSKVVVVLRSGLRCIRYHSNDLIHLQSVQPTLVL